MTIALIALSTTGTASAALVEQTDILQLSVGPGYGCLVTTGGAVKCWGENFSGQLGDGTTYTREVVGRVPALSGGVVAVATPKYGSHACALTVTGSVKCWGANDAGQLGDGTTTTRLEPVDVLSLPLPATALSLGGKHSCALLSDGSAMCWGRNDEGQLGDGALVQRLLPTKVLALGPAKSLSAGSLHTCAVTNDGAAWCWGANESGELGDGTTTARSLPVGVASLGSGVASIAAHSLLRAFGVAGSAPWPAIGYSCAVMMSGGAKCWGAAGALGAGDSNAHFTPVEVSGLTSGVAAVTPAGSHYSLSAYVGGTALFACAKTSSGAAKCWGRNYCGAVGNGQTYPDTCPYWPTFLAPVDVVGLSSGVVDVSAGGLHACALLSTGKARCWGAYIGNDPYATYQSYSVTPTPLMTGTIVQNIGFTQPTWVPVGSVVGLEASGGYSGNPLTFASLTPSICSVDNPGTCPNQATACKVNVAVRGLAQGKCTLAFNQAGNEYYDSAPQRTLDLRVGDPRNQTITFGSAPMVPLNGVGHVGATASSGLPVTFTSNTPSICTVSGSMVTGVAVGSCTIAARQNGDFYYAAVEAVQTFNVTANTGTVVLSVSKAGGGGGTVTSSPAGINCGTACAGNFTTGNSVMLSATANSDSFFTGWSGSCGGTGSCTVTMNAARSVTATFASNTSIQRLVNISTRGKVLTGENVLIGGFIVSGDTPKTLVVRGRGPWLASQGVTGVLVDPKLDLYSGQTLIAANDNWQSAANSAELSASGYAPSIAAESAILTTLNPGPYTAVVSGVGGMTGVGIVEVFELDQPQTELINIATRGQVLTGNDVLIGGFAISGNTPLTVVVRASGPSLGNQGVANPLADPVLELFSGQTMIASNDNWASASNAQQLSSSGFAPLHPNESAILITLNPGLYTAIVRGANGSTGVGTVEVFAQ